MKTLYLDCSMGAAGDMLAAALLELVNDPEAILSQIQLDGVTLSVEKGEQCSVTGTHFCVDVDGQHEDEHMHDHHHHHHHHHHLKDIEHIVSHLGVEKAVKDDILAVYTRIAKAEAKVHGKEMDNIHFHEVGTKDAIADIATVCLLMHTLQPDQVIASPVHVGYGQVKCAHGILPVPAPATAILLEGIPIYSKDIEGELCTPTGAALLGHFVDRFEQMPMMTVRSIGYGLGTKEFPVANCLRALWSQDEDQETETIWELSCQIDDMSGEDIGFAMDVLLENGARDVFTTPIGMKKSRPGVLLTVLCDAGHREAMVRLMFRHTTTIGIRQKECTRYVLIRKEEVIETSFGQIRCKISQGYGTIRRKWEYDDLARIAKEHQLSMEQVRQQLEEELDVEY